MGNDLGVNYKTVSAWISVLEASYIAFLLYPHHENFAKRLIKSPKLYFPWYRQFTPPAPGKMGSGEQRPGR